VAGPAALEGIGAKRLDQGLLAFGPCDVWAFGIRTYEEPFASDIVIERLDSDVVAVEPVEPGSAIGIDRLRVAPNPFRALATFRYTLSAPASVRVSVITVSGQEVVRLRNGVETAGERVATWDGRDAAGRVMPAGVYVVQVQTPEGALSHRVVHLGR
jgi:hypothetical protein